MGFYPIFQEDANRVAAIDGNGTRLSYRQLVGFSQALGGTLRQRALVFALCENSTGSLVGCAAFLNNRIVPLLLDADLDRQLLDCLLQCYLPAYLWLPARLRNDFPMFTPCLEAHDYLLLATGFGEQKPLYDNLALLLTTSGSTGSRKLVRISYENLRANGTSIIEYLGIDATERPITTLPMHYSYGFSIINSHLMAGATILFTDKTLVEKEFWDFFREQRATSFGGVPYTFEMLKRMRFMRMDLPSLKTITQAGGKLSTELIREFAEYATQKGIRFFVMYGQTEASPRISYLPPERLADKCGSIGIAIPGGELFLVADDGSLITEPEAEGELVYRGANVTLGYAECREDLSKGDERGGVLYTGDLARQDRDGFCYITGRRKRFIKLYGNRVNLDETEQIVKTVLSDCACCGTDDRMVIFITEAGRETEIRQLVAARTGINPSAFVVQWVADIPKNEAGKTRYAALPCPGEPCSI